jgi:hypothetical protein
MIEGEADGERHGGLMSITMRQYTREDGRKGHIETRIEPSARLPRTGIFVMVNDHYVFDEAETKDSSQAMEVIDLGWEDPWITRSSL